MYKLGFIGLGNMAGALIKGFISSGYLNKNDICGSDISEKARIKARESGIYICSNNQETVNKSELIIIAVKPQYIEDAVAKIKDNLKGKAFVSVVLGYGFEKYENLLDNSVRHLTIMPNTPVEVGEGMILLEEKHSLREEEWKFIKEGLEKCGSIEVIPSQLMSAAGALSGCGPAYLYMVIEALADGAVKNGIPRKTAYKLASQTVIGAGKMQLISGIHPGVLKDNVTSPGGSTIKGLKALEDGNIRAAFINASDQGCQIQ